MTEYDIRTRPTTALLQRVAYLTHEINAAGVYFPATLDQLKAERRAIADELAYRRAEDSREAHEATVAVGGWA
jgi:hypothetical protein